MGDVGGHREPSGVVSQGSHRDPSASSGQALEYSHLSVARRAPPADHEPLN